jgi:rhodanese-related sulfurtransferase
MSNPTLRSIVALFIGVLFADTAGTAMEAAIPVLPPRIGYTDLVKLLTKLDSTLLLIDVRTAEEYAAGHIPGAILSPYDLLGRDFTEPDKGRPIVVYCRSGRRSAIAAQTLKEMGYMNISDFGSIDSWRGAIVTGATP